MKFFNQISWWWSTWTYTNRSYYHREKHRTDKLYQNYLIVEKQLYLWNHQWRSHSTVRRPMMEPVKKTFHYLWWWYWQRFFHTNWQWIICPTKNNFYFPLVYRYVSLKTNIDWLDSYIKYRIIVKNNLGYKNSKYFLSNWNRKTPRERTGKKYDGNIHIPRSA